jgi:hypothetical protein
VSQWVSLSARDEWARPQPLAPCRAAKLAAMSNTGSAALERLIEFRFMI